MNTFEILLAEILAIDKAGADYIIIATNTMHKLADAIPSKIKIPLVHIADCVAEKCLEKKKILDFLEQNTHNDRRFEELCKGKIKKILY